MAEYKFFRKGPTSQEPGDGDTPPNYYHLYVITALAAFDALDALENLNIGEAKKILEGVCRLAELHQLPDPD